MRALLTPLLLVLAPEADGQCQQATPYGQAGTHCQGSPTLQGGLYPRVGGRGFALQIDHALPGTLAAASALLASGSAASLPIACSAAPSLWLLVDLTRGVALPLAIDPTGGALVPLTIPPSPPLAGQVVYFQLVQAEVPPACAPCLPGLGLAASAGLAAQIQLPSCPGGIAGNPALPPSIAIQSAGPTLVTGTASNVDADAAQVALWVLTDRWYVQPTSCRPFTDLCVSQGAAAWSSATNPGVRQLALLVDASYAFATPDIYHPALAQGVLAWDQVPPPAQPIPLLWSGHAWGIKVSGARFGPGPNFWSDSLQNVSVDAQGRLRLAIVQDAQGRWTCAEVHLTRPLGYGKYSFQLDSPVDALDTNTVASGFLYEDQTHELDFEFAGDALIPGAPNAQHVAQPYTTPGNKRTFAMPSVAQSSHRVDWSATAVRFTSWQGHAPWPPPAQDVLLDWTYPGPDIPTPNARFHCNLWLFGGRAPASGAGDSLLVRSFSFVP